MPEIPLPFVVSGVLLVVLVRLMKHGTRERWFILFVGACALQTAIVGLRWSVDLGWVRFVQPVLAACLPPLALAAFETLGGARLSCRHGLWPVAVVVAWWLVPSAIDPLLILEFLLYGLLVFRFPLPDDVLENVRIGDEWTVSRTRNGVAVLLVLSAAVDTVVAVAFAEGDGTIAAPVIAAMMSVVLLGLAAGLLARTAGAMPDNLFDTAEGPSAAAGPDADEEQAVIITIETALAKGLYRDYDLTLVRLSRRTRIPARKISQAVNRIRGCSVTDLVNRYRVDEAMRLLRESDLPITQIMLEAGFQTKSNFNRAFKGIAGQTPSAYRNSGSR